MMLAGTQAAEIAKSVSDIQKALLMRGFNPGVIDGKMGPRTKAAIQAFQKAAGLKVDGIVGPLTSAALFKSEPLPSVLPSGSGTPSQTPRAVTSPASTIVDSIMSAFRSASPGNQPLIPDVGQKKAPDAFNDTPMSRTPAPTQPAFSAQKTTLDVQRALLAQGFNPGTLDGKMGPNTKAAILAYQQSRGLKADGIVGPQTSAALFGGAPAISTPTVPSQPSYMPTPAPAVIISEPAAPNISPSMMTQPWFLPVIAGLGVFALASMKGKK